MICILDGNQGTSATKSKGKARDVLCLAVPRRQEEYCWIVARLISLMIFYWWQTDLPMEAGGTITDFLMGVVTIQCAKARS
jgi:hypothetical protein